MKKIISVSYYADFSRYFRALHGNFHNPNIEWINICLYHSAYVFDLLHNVKTIFLPSEIRKRKFKNLKSKFDIGSINYTYLKNSDTKINDIALLYSNYFEYFLKIEKPDLIILSGDERLPIKILRHVAFNLGIKVLYFEQGPFGTTILDKDGVNANCSFRRNCNQELQSEKKLFLLENKKEKWQGYKKYRLLDIIYQLLFPNTYPELIKYKLSIPKNKKNSPIINKITTGTYTKKYILLILQVPEDVNMVCHSPYFSNHTDIIKKIHTSIPSQYKLVVREHPLYKGKYESSLYDYINSNKISLDCNGNLVNLIKNSILVIVNNSTVGLEAMLHKKSVLILGNSYYDNENYIYKYHGEKLREKILEAINKPIDINEVDMRLNYLFNHHFLSGHFRDKDLSSIPEHVRKINEFIL